MSRSCATIAQTAKQEVLAGYRKENIRKDARLKNADNPDQD